MGLTPPSLDRAIPSRAISPMDSRVTVVTASHRTPQAMARAAMVLMDRPRTQAMALSQLPRDMAQRVAMAARVLNLLMGSSPPTLAMASSQPLAAPREVMVAVLRAAATMGSPRVGVMVSSLAMVDNSKTMDSSKAPIILLRAMDRTSTTVAVEVAEGVVEVTTVKINPP